jgi:hypothetical protein
MERSKSYDASLHSRAGLGRSAFRACASTYLARAIFSDVKSRVTRRVMCKYESFFPSCTTCIYKYLQSFYPPQKAHKSTHHGEIKQIWRLEQLSSHSTIRHIIAIVYFRKSTAEKAISNCARNEFWASTGTV